MIRHAVGLPHSAGFVATVHSGNGFTGGFSGWQASSRSSARSEIVTLLQNAVSNCGVMYRIQRL